MHAGEAFTRSDENAPFFGLETAILRHQQTVGLVVNEHNSQISEQPDLDSFNHYLRLAPQRTTKAISEGSENTSAILRQTHLQLLDEDHRSQYLQATHAIDELPVNRLAPTICEKINSQPIEVADQFLVGISWKIAQAAKIKISKASPLEYVSQIEKYCLLPKLIINKYFRQRPAAEQEALGIVLASAINIELDNQTWNQVRFWSQERGVNSVEVNSLLGATSSPVSLQAMRAGLDWNVWRGIALHTMSQQSRLRLLGQASSPIAKEAMRSHLEELRRKLDGQLSDEARVSRYSIDPSKIALDAIAKDRGLRWLKGEEDTIRRLYTTVTKVREQARSNGSTLSDKELYILYRRQLEQAGSNSPQLAMSFQVLHALMGGVNGQLPF